MPEGDYVWYTGRMDERRMEAADWSAHGATGGTVVWNKANGFSVLKETLTMEQLGVLALSNDFRFDGSGSVRPNTYDPGGSARNVAAGEQALGWLGKHLKQSGGGHVFKSPNGTNWILTVSNTGVITAVQYAN